MRRGLRGHASGCEGAMALSWLQRLELALFVPAFLCGALAAATLTRTQACSLPPHRGRVGLCIALALSAVAIFLVLVSACVLRFGTSALCNSILSQNTTISCSEAQKIPWTPRGTALHFYSNLHNAENASWVNLVLWCVVLVLQIMQLKSDTTPFRPLETGDPEWSSETDVLVGPRLSRP
ncbi:transmembrane protein 179B isoform X2 [Phyllostomus hastatus]|uniref:transmembrane protein 179B isoform X2 n=1 Tax=Phyllostomus hastatus TaxID=9423 RepID=UPI001E684F2B|nr:transmembrane protein 179B isoform X2 [Phyllostomus hastatus]